MDEEIKVAEETPAVEEVKPKRRGGRKPMTPEQKAEAARLRAEKKQMADNLKPAIFVQFQETQADVNELVESARAAFRAEKKRTRITDMKLYIKPEERAAYYVINEKSEGKISY
ncbi:MAG: hypothetical protein IJT94_15405 [Oscillibacter sp.]|nr:hypothetical protein [Oscillibacter sp.]